MCIRYFSLLHCFLAYLMAATLKLLTTTITISSSMRPGFKDLASSSDVAATRKQGWNEFTAR